MQLRPDRVAADLERHGLRRVYLVFGDEPQQQLEVTDAIRLAAKADGAEERLVFDVQPGFDWSALTVAAGSMSLFSARRLIELRLGTAKLDAQGAEVLVELTGALAPEDTLLVTADKLERGAQNSRWFKRLDAAGVVVAARRLDPKALKPWLAARAARHGKTLSGDAVELIAARVEGNLVAAAQEIAKLCLLVDDDDIDADRVIAAVTDNSRFDVFALVDAAVAGDPAQTLRILRELRAEGTAVLVVGWALNRELRSLAYMAADLARGTPVEAVLKQHKVWQSRLAAVRRALERHRFADLLSMLRHSALIDRMIKGTAIGTPWDELEQLGLRLAGIGVLPPCRRYEAADARSVT